MESNSEEEAAMVTQKSSSSEWNPFSETKVEENGSEWADFSPQTPQKCAADQIETEDEWTDFVETPQIVHKNPLMSLIENFLLNKNKNEINFCQNISENELDIDNDSTWNELKCYTSINDESLSLKFKWPMSNLEDEYLKSLNLQRQFPVQQKQPLFLNTNEILQPVKIDLDSHNTEAVDETSPKHSLQSLDEITNSTLNIDLSYFEQTEPENTSKNYLNKLLSEIYSQNGSSGKDEDADKKCINSKTKTFNNLNSMENLTKNKEIIDMCWSDQLNQQEIFFCTKDQHIIKYNSLKNIQDPFLDLGSFECGQGELAGMQIIAENKLVTCVDKGLMKLWNLDDKNFGKTIVNEFKCGSDIFAIKKNPFNSNQIATGGKENDLKIWNLNKTEPIFKAKNVSDNWIQLREPVWVTAIDFVDENRVVVGTGHHQVRVYDLKTGIRRPIYNLNYGENPLTALMVLPDSSNRVIVGNTRGEMEMIDLRSATSKNEQCKTVKKYKGFQGTIKSIHIENSPLYNLNGSNLCVATCGLDRFLRVHHVESSMLLSKVYLKSRLNCLLFSKHEPTRPEHKKTEEIEEDQISNVNSEDLGTDDLWSDIETIVDEHPSLIKKSKKKLEKRLQDFDSESLKDEDQKDSDGFLKPKSLKKIRKIK